MELNDDPRMPYSRNRAAKLTAQTLSSHDDKFKEIDDHLHRIKNREKSNQFNDLLKKANSPSKKNTSSVKIGELVFNNGTIFAGQPKEETVLLDTGQKPVRRKI